MLLDAFKSKLRDDGAPSAEIRPDLLSSRSRSSSTDTIAPSNASKIPPRLLSDQFINIYFQEWAPLLPILHRPTLLKFYEDFLADPDSFQSNKQAIAQLYLVFEIAALSSVVSQALLRQMMSIDEWPVSNQAKYHLV